MHEAAEPLGNSTGTGLRFAAEQRLEVACDGNCRFAYIPFLDSIDVAFGVN